MNTKTKENTNLDRQVAELVMGWTERDLSTQDRLPNWIWWCNGDGLPEKLVKNFRPSREVEDVWRVIERLAKTFEFVFFIEKNGKARASFTKATERYIHEFPAEEDTAEVAICTAALKAAQYGSADSIAAAELKMGEK